MVNKISLKFCTFLDFLPPWVQLKPQLSTKCSCYNKKVSPWWDGTIAGPLPQIQNGITVLPVTNLTTDSELKTPISYLHLTVTAALSCLLSEIFPCNMQTLAHSAGPANNTNVALYCIGNKTGDDTLTSMTNKKNLSTRNMKMKNGNTIEMTQN